MPVEASTVIQALMMGIIAIIGWAFKAFRDDWNAFRANYDVDQRDNSSAIQGRAKPDRGSQYKNCRHRDGSKRAQQKP